jgi:hypothetical protein
MSTSKRLPMQVDGEPRWQLPGTIEVGDPTQAFLLSLRHHADLLNSGGLLHGGGSSSIDQLHHHTIHSGGGEGVVDGVIASVFDWATEKGVIDTQQRNVLLEEMARKLEQTRARRKYQRIYGSLEEDEDESNHMNLNWNGDNGMDENGQPKHTIHPVVGRGGGRSTTATITRRRPTAITTDARTLKAEQDDMMGHG